MQYRADRQGTKLSILGFGCMRFPRKGSGIDMEETGREIRRAVELGVNYFDTAYIYPGSEAALGEILEKDGLRDRVYIATKLPQYLIRSREGIEKYFQEQLRRLRTDHVDYYLMHMLTDIEAWNKLTNLGIREWIAEKKAQGAIRRIGFSYHGNTQIFLELLNAYDWDFCQIQYNYLDEHTQAGRAGLEAAHRKGIPVVIMEPLRGGKLVNLLPRDAKEKIAAEGEGRTAAELALRWLWDQEGVSVVLSGMNSMAMLEENCRIASESPAGCLSERERTLIASLRDSLLRSIKIGCTGCGYCMPCPQGVDIPGTFRCYNHMATEGKSAGRNEYFQTVALRKNPPFASQCVRCGKCEKHCPQHLPIIRSLQEADQALRPLPRRIAISVSRKWLFNRRARSGSGSRRTRPASR